MHVRLFMLCSLTFVWKFQHNKRDVILIGLRSYRAFDGVPQLLEVKHERFQWNMVFVLLFADSWLYFEGVRKGADVRV